MSGHSKWSQIKRQKQKADVKRGLVFTKLANAITIAVRDGGGVADPTQNFRLRLAIDASKSVNMPKENVERAIQRALKKEAGNLEEVVYEGFAPGGVALVIKAASDNKNRTTSEIKNLLEKNGGTFASLGAVSWMFKDQGLIAITRGNKTYDEIFEVAVDLGAEDVKEAGKLVEIYTKPNELYSIKNSLENKGLSVQDAQLTKNSTTTVEVKDPEMAKKILSLVDKLEDLEDVQNVYANFDIPENIIIALKDE
ncbi:MAG: YebC/PmpR family DNA-binding transcriptional regulator [Candidatus Levybacteria bacterium]|nr:YebC/PmpR family DNA-binding transcriptional regulator [Candidatus Levybacteria bacterium]